MADENTGAGTPYVRCDSHGTVFPTSSPQVYDHRAATGPGSAATAPSSSASSAPAPAPASASASASAPAAAGAHEGTDLFELDAAIVSHYNDQWTKLVGASVAVPDTADTVLTPVERCGPVCWGSGAGGVCGGGGNGGLGARGPGEGAL